MNANVDPTVIVTVDGIEEPKKLSVEEAKERAEGFSPLTHWNENTFYSERDAIMQKVHKQEHYTHFDLEELIAFLQEVHSKFGNMPIVYFNGKLKTFNTFMLSDIDIVKSYFTISGNLKGTFMKIKNSKALSFFHG